MKTKSEHLKSEIKNLPKREKRRARTLAHHLSRARKLNRHSPKAIPEEEAASSARLMSDERWDEYLISEWEGEGGRLPIF